MTVITWPSGLRLSGGGDWHLAVNSGTPGRGLAGHQQIIARENRTWQCDLRLGVVDAAMVPIWQAFVDDLFGMAHRISLPVCNAWRPRIPGEVTYYYPDIATPDQILYGVEHSDAALFGDDVGYALPGVRDPVTVGAVPAGATILTLEGETAALLGVGAFFSVDGFLHRVAANAAGVIRFNPPLRVAVADGTEINVSATRIICRLASDDAGRLRTGLKLRGEPMQVSVVEAFDR